MCNENRAQNDKSDRVCKTRRKSVAIMAVYDPDGVIDDYIVYYINSLKIVANRIVVVVNGKVNAEGAVRLHRVADDIYIRPNRGFDFGAYKDVLQKRLPLEIWDEYQELILCNDTCFGPFVPFAAIFSDMDKRNLEFWSANYMDNILLPHYQSYFMVFRGRAIELVKSFLAEVVDENITDITYAQGYEHSLSEFLMQQEGIEAGFYTSGHRMYPNMDIYRSPDYAIRCLGLPFLKKRCFNSRIIKEENCYSALALIQKNTDYPIQYIIRSIKRIYGLDIRMESIDMQIWTNPYSFWKFKVSREEVISFCRNHKKVFLYGKGYFSVLIFARFQRYMKEFGGYIVSDGHYIGELKADGMVFPLSVMDRDTPVIVALLEKNSREVYELLEGWDNALFLSI